MNKILGLLFVTIIFFPVASSAASYRNELPQKDWTKYGVNPWVRDTDNDGYSDAHEIKWNWCPTNPEAVRPDDPSCLKGKINLKTGVYDAPEAVKRNSASTISKFKDCAGVEENLKKGLSGASIFLGDVLKKEVTKAVDNQNEEVVDDNSLKNILVNLESSKVTSKMVVSGNYRYFVSRAILPSENSQGLYSMKLYVLEKGSPTYKNLVSLDFGEGSGQEKFLKLFSIKNRLYLVTSDYAFDLDINWLSTLGKAAISATSQNVRVRVISVANPKKPFVEKTILMPGSFLGAHVDQNKFYLALQYYSFTFDAGKLEAVRYNNTVANYVTFGGEMNGATKSALSKAVSQTMYRCNQVEKLSNQNAVRLVSVVMLDPATGNKLNVQKTIALSEASVGFLGDSMYLWSERYGDPNSIKYWSDAGVEIYKYKLGNSLSLVASQYVAGINPDSLYVLSSKEINRSVHVTKSNVYITTFSIDEENLSASKTNLYILDQNLSRVGWAEDVMDGKADNNFLLTDDYAYFARAYGRVAIYDLRDKYQPKQVSLLGYSDPFKKFALVKDNYFIGFGGNDDRLAAQHSDYLSVDQGMVFAVTRLDENNYTQGNVISVGDRGTSVFFGDWYDEIYIVSGNYIAMPVSEMRLSKTTKQMLRELSASDTTTTWASFFNKTRNVFSGYKVFRVNGTSLEEVVDVSIPLLSEYAIFIDGDRLVAATSDGKILVYDLKTGNVESEFGM